MQKKGKFTHNNASKGMSIMTFPIVSQVVDSSYFVTLLGLERRIVGTKIKGDQI